MVGKWNYCDITYKRNISICKANILYIAKNSIIKFTPPPLKKIAYFIHKKTVRQKSNILLYTFII